jgi:hypothetical protein
MGKMSADDMKTFEEAFPDPADLANPETGIEHIRRESKRLQDINE